MSRVKFSENMFLEVNELKRLVKFIGDDGYKKIFKAVVESPGIVRNELNTNFKPIEKEGEPNTVKITKGLAYDSNLDAIESLEDVEITLNDTGEKQWILLSRGHTNIEKGVVSVNTDGSMSGVGTNFTEVLRGQPNFPTKVKLTQAGEPESDLGEYEVVKVISDTSAILSGSFSAQTGLKFSVIGTFTPGFQPLSENKMIYEYDSYKIRVIQSENTPVLSKGEYFIASVHFDSLGVMNIEDERVVNMFNEKSVVDSEGGSDYNPSNSSVSLISVSNVGVNERSADIELILEHGYKITEFELSSTVSSKVFKIRLGSNNFFGNGDIPDGFFKGWTLLNRSNMKHVTIDDNVNKELLVSRFQSSITYGVISDFVIIPNFDEIEYEITVSNNVEDPSTPFYFKSSIWNISSRIRLYSYFKKIDVKFSEVVSFSLRCRMLGSGTNQVFRTLPISQFNNIKGVKETLSSSSFNVNVSELELVEKQRNYS